MTPRPPATYDRTQHGVLHRVFLVVAALELAAGVVVGSLVKGEEGTSVGVILGCSAAFFALISATMARMRIHDDGAALRVVLGPVELFRKRVPYASIRSVQPYETTVLRHGVGIHMAPGGGWTWNLKKGPAVELVLEKGRLILGTDDPAELVAFLQAKLRRG